MAIDSELPSPVVPPATEKHAKALEFIEELTENCHQVQLLTLEGILTTNAGTEYHKRYGLGGATDRDSFKSKFPVVTYEDLEPDILRSANGDKSPILSSRPISEFLTSSGTSAGGERKLMPTVSDEMDRRQNLYILLPPVMSQYVPDLDKGKGMYFLFVKEESKTPGGLVARPVLTSYYKSEQFKTRPYDPFNVYTSPNEAILCPDSDQSMYTQMLCGLLMRDQVNRVGAVFASGLLRAIRFLQLNWRQLVEDISTGALCHKVTDPTLRDCIGKIHSKPDEKLAEFITEVCSGENWERIITRMWPNTKYLDVIVTGAMAQYIPTLEYYSGGLPMACTMYASSECYFGLNLKPMCKPSEVSYCIMPNMGYFEFIPHDPTALPLSRDSPPRLLDLAELKIGKEYELVVSTYSGLCRYQVGDILRVVGFHNSAPLFKFIRRKNVLLCIDADKTNEWELQRAVDKASSLLLEEFDASVLEYTSYADTKTIPGHYVIYWELLVKDHNNEPTHEALDRCCLEMEEAMNSVYRQCRVSDNSIGPLEIRVVKNGTFDKLMDYAISRGASINQYKVPRCVSFTPIVELMDAKVVSDHFSPSKPRWTPDRRH